MIFAGASLLVFVLHTKIIKGRGGVRFPLIFSLGSENIGHVSKP